MELYQIEKDARCIRCDNTGAIRYFGEYNGDTGELHPAINPNEVSPYKCMKCGSIGLIGEDNLGGYGEGGYMITFKKLEEEAVKIGEIRFN